MLCFCAICSDGGGGIGAIVQLKIGSKRGAGGGADIGAGADVVLAVDDVEAEAKRAVSRNGV